jgi:glycosyltransferase involved in cell wall biosynthesis
MFKLSYEVKKNNCDVLFTLDAASTCRFTPMVTLSQDLLSYEPGILEDLKFGFERLRLYIILYLQNKTFNHSSGVIFLTNYARNIIQNKCGHLSNTIVIPHGVDIKFHDKNYLIDFPLATDKIRCIYISPNFKYKYQLNVASAIANLKNKGYDIEILFIGEGSLFWKDLLVQHIDFLDPTNHFLKYLGNIENINLPIYISQSNIFIFASGCETFGITLLEGMSSGICIACSNQSSLPETLQDGGVYFNPREISEIENAIITIINNPILRSSIISKAKELSKYYTWLNCSESTFQFIIETYKKYKINGK